MVNGVRLALREDYKSLASVASACQDDGVNSPLLTREQCRALDRRAIDELGIPGIVLMENAGRGCVDLLEQNRIDGPVVIFCGKGNNAGDGFVIARHLAVRDHECHVLLFADPDELRGDAAENFNILRRTRAPIINLTQQSLPDPGLLRGATWLVDALLGTGSQGNPRPPFDRAIHCINEHGANARVLAVDVPSGLDCDSGQPATPTVRADLTCTFAAMKPGFLEPAAQEFTGTVHVRDIGVPVSLFFP